MPDKEEMLAQNIWSLKKENLCMPLQQMDVQEELILATDEEKKADKVKSTIGRYDMSLYMGTGVQIISALLISSAPTNPFLPINLMWAPLATRLYYYNHASQSALEKFNPCSLKRINRLKDKVLHLQSFSQRLENKIKKDGDDLIIKEFRSKSQDASFVLKQVNVAEKAFTDLHTHYKRAYDGTELLRSLTNGCRDNDGTYLKIGFDESRIQSEERSVYVQDYSGRGYGRWTTQTEVKYIPGRSGYYDLKTDEKVYIK